MLDIAGVPCFAALALEQEIYTTDELLGAFKMDRMSKVPWCAGKFENCHRLFN